MRKLAVGVVLFLGSVGCFAADVGIGVSAKSDDAWVYLPIDWSAKYRLEPSVRRAKTTSSTDQPPSQTRSGSFTRQEVEALEIGIGAFRIFSVAESAKVSIGLRLAYVDSKSTIESGTSSTVGPISQSRSEAPQEGYRIAPTIGFEYLFGEHFSIGGEASYSFLDIDGTGSTRQTTTTIGGSFVIASEFEAEQRTQGTGTQLILRYMF